MTVLNRVSAREMKRRTGFGKALGYAFPDEDEILILKDLPKKVEHEVIAHEEEHIAKGEEGPFAWGALIGGALGLLGAKKSSDAAKKGTQAQVDASNKEIAYAKETRDLLRADQAPYRRAGATALDALMSLTGLGGGGGGAPPPQAQARNPLALSREQVAGTLSQSRGSSYGDSGYTSRFRRKNIFDSRAQGGPMDGGQYYNINELGPESVYMDGEYTRTPSPRTISGEGYVQPNIQGRALGGFMQDRNIKYGAGNPMVGWGGPQRVQPGPQTPQNANTTAVNPQTGYPNENPGGVEGGYQFQTEPGYQFRFEEGQRALDRGAAARGGLLSGGYARKAIRYGQGFASNEYANVYNRIANIAGLGQTANQANMYGGLQTAGQVGNALSNQGAARASGYAANANIWGDALGGVAKLPWDEWFGGSGNGSPT